MEMDLIVLALTTWTPVEFDPAPFGSLLIRGPLSFQDKMVPPAGEVRVLPCRFSFFLPRRGCRPWKLYPSAFGCP